MTDIRSGLRGWGNCVVDSLPIHARQPHLQRTDKISNTLEFFFYGVITGTDLHQGKHIHLVSLCTSLSCFYLISLFIVGLFYAIK